MMKLLLIVAASLLSVASVAAQSTKGFYRYPTLHTETIVFAAEGDLWTVPVDGGVARRLTTHPGEETAPTISPDGRTLAFAATYEGPTEVYTMPLAGGLPTRRTYEAEPSTPAGWTPGGNLLYATTHYATLPNPQLVTMDLDSQALVRVPLSEATEGAFDRTGRTLYFVRPAFHRNVTKRYRGGTARKIWRFAEGASEADLLTPDYPGESHSPMWWNDRVYFVSDRDGTMNLWSIDDDGGDLRQHTSHAGWDVKDPDLHQGRIVYHLAADLWLYDIAQDRTRTIPITLASDFDQLRERWVTNPMDYLTSAHLHPSGEAVALTARGRVFVVPVGDGRLVRASHEPGVRYRDVVFMPDGRLLGLTDATGELEFTLLPANGVGAPEPLTSDGMPLRFQGHPSPDGRRIAYRNNDRELWMLDVVTGSQRRVSTNHEGVQDISWSPDGRWLTFSQAARNTFLQVVLHEVETASTVALTSDRVNSTSAVWSADGRWIYFLSDRNLRSVVGSPWGPRAPEPFFDKPMKIFEIAVRRGVRSRFAPATELDERSTADTADPADGSGLLVEVEGIDRRVREVPVPAGDYRGLDTNERGLYWLSRSVGLDAPTDLIGVAFEEPRREPQTIVEDVSGFELSLDRTSMLVHKDDHLYVIPAEPTSPPDLTEARLDLEGWTFPIDVREDWRQIFVDAWRLERDYFYDPNMHGVDWRGVLDKYLPLVDRVTSRDELSDLIGRVVGELSALHTSVRGGDLRRGSDDVELGTLGARLTRDTAAGGYRVEYVYQGDPDYPSGWSPLAHAAYPIEAGDVIETVNGIDTLSVAHIDALLRNQADRQVLLRVRPASSAERRDVIVTPIRDEANLRYTDWEVTRRQRVENRGDGKLGYVHLRATGSRDLTAWYQQFYPVFDRQGLVIDMRRNRGGNIDSLLLEKLMRRAWMYWKTRHREPYWNMQYAFRGHMVVLVDQQTASDGEAFAEGFRRLGLGPAIGTRTWGGEIWLGSANRLTDDGLARAPSNGVYGAEGEWLIEGHGFEPDIVVDNLPHATFNGADAQLDAAIEYLLDAIARDPREVPPPPPFPNKAFAYPVPTADQGGR